MNLEKGSLLKVLSTYIFFSIVFWCIICFAPFKLEQSDEFGLMILASGNYTGTPESILVFISPLIGKLLNLLYSIFPRGFNCYSLFFVVIYYKCWLVILYLFNSNKSKSIGWGQVFFYLLFLVFGVKFLMNISFTVAAYQCGIVAILIYFFLKDSVFKLPLFVLFFSIAFLIRTYAFYYLAAVFCSFLLIDFMIYKIIPNIKVLILMFLSVILLNNFGSNDVTKKPEWKKYSEFNITRGNILDNPNFYYNKPADIKRRMNWTDTDYEMFYNWNIDYEVTYNIESLKKLHSIIEFKFYLCTYFLNYIFFSFKIYYYLGGIMFFLLLINQDRKYILQLLLKFSIVIFSIVGISFFYMLKERVLFPPLFLLSIYFLLHNINSNSFGNAIKNKNRIIVFFGSLMAVLSVYLFIAQSVSNRKDQICLEENISALNNFGKMKYVLWGDLKMNNTKGFLDPYANFENCFYISNWFSGLPHNRVNLDKINAKNIYSFGLNNKYCIWISEDEKYNLKSNLLKQFYFEKFNLKVKTEKLLFKNKKLSNWVFYRIVSE